MGCMDFHLLFQFCKILLRFASSRLRDSHVRCAIQNVVAVECTLPKYCPAFCPVLCRILWVDWRSSNVILQSPKVRKNLGHSSSPIVVD